MHSVPMGYLGCGSTDGEVSNARGGITFVFCLMRHYRYSISD